MSARWKYALILLLLIAIVVWLAVLAYPNNNRLSIVTCDVGQGDAVLVVSGRHQILVDGGPGNDVLECLSRHMPFWDRRIELVILSHPQKDHFGGLIEVFERYDVELFLANELDSGAQEYQLLKSEVGGLNTKVVKPVSGMVVRLGMIYLDIVHPSMKFLAEKGEYVTNVGSGVVLGSYSSRSDPNDFSVVAILRYKNFDALLTGDIGPDVVDDLISSGGLRDVEYIKVPHHGSKNGLSRGLLDVVKPEVAAISVGEKNRYGHPHKEVLDMLKETGVAVYRTDEVGDIVLLTEGDSFSVNY